MSKATNKLELLGALVASSFGIARGDESDEIRTLLREALDAVRNRPELGEEQYELYERTGLLSVDFTFESKYREQRL